MCLIPFIKETGRILSDFPRLRRKGRLFLMSAEAVRAAGFDKFYTKPEIVDRCLQSLLSKYPWTTWDLVIEPSAGNGRFYTKIQHLNKIGLDLVPDLSGLLQQDFLTYTPPAKESILVIGNPPFGKNSSLAIRFFQHAARWATTIAFIVPRTFRRTSVQNRLSPHFHLCHDEEIPLSPCAFEPPMMAKCCFQIWTRSTSPRQKVVFPLTHPDWRFLPFGPKDAAGQPTPPTGASFALRAYGGSIGEIRTTGLVELRPKSWHWIQALGDPVQLRQRFEGLDYSQSVETARQNSLGKADLVLLYSVAYP